MAGGEAAAVRFSAPSCEQLKRTDTSSPCTTYTELCEGTVRVHAGSASQKLPLMPLVAPLVASAGAWGHWWRDAGAGSL